MARFPWTLGLVLATSAGLLFSGCSGEDSSHQSRGLLALREGQYEQAISLLEIALDQKETPEARIALARARRALGRREGALRALDSLLVSDAPASHDEAFQLAAELQNPNAISDSLADAVRIRAQGATASVPILLASAALEGHRLEAARRAIVDLLERARKEGASSIVQRLARIDTSEDTEGLPDAYLALQTAMGAAAVEACQQLRRTAERAARARVIAFQRAEALAPGDPQTRLAHARAVLDLSPQETSAVESLLAPFLGGLSGPPTAEADRAAFELWIMALDASEEVNRIIELLEAPLLAGDSRAMAYWPWLARAYYRRGPKDGRLAEFMVPIAKEDPSNAWAQFFAGVGLYWAGELEEALPWLRRAAALLEGQPLFHHWHGLALAKSGRTELAVGQFERSSRLAGDDYRYRIAGAVALEESQATRASRELLLAVTPRGSTSLGAEAPPAEIQKALVSSWMRELQVTSADQLKARFEKDPTQPLFALALAEQHLAKGDLPTADQLASVVAEDHPWLVRASLLSAEIAVRLGRRDLAATRLDRLLLAFDAARDSGADVSEKEVALARRLRVSLDIQTGQIATAEANLGPLDPNFERDDHALFAHLASINRRWLDALASAREVARSGPIEEDWWTPWIRLETLYGDLAVADAILSARPPGSVPAKLRIAIAAAASLAGNTTATAERWRRVLEDPAAEANDRLSAARALFESREATAEDEALVQAIVRESSDPATIITAESLLCESAARNGQIENFLVRLSALRERSPDAARNTAIPLLIDPFNRPGAAFDLAFSSELATVDLNALNALSRADPGPLSDRKLAQAAAHIRGRGPEGERIAKRLDLRIQMRMFARMDDTTATDERIQAAGEDQAIAELAYAEELFRTGKDDQISAFLASRINPESSRRLAAIGLRSARRSGQPGALRRASRLRATEMPNDPAVKEAEALLAFLSGSAEAVMELLPDLEGTTKSALQDALAINFAVKPSEGSLAAYAQALARGELQARRRALAGLQAMPRTLHADLVRIQSLLESNGDELLEWCRLLAALRLAQEEPLIRSNFLERLDRFGAATGPNAGAFTVTFAWMKQTLGDPAPALQAWRNALRENEIAPPSALLAIQSFVGSGRREQVDELLKLLQDTTGVPESLASDVAGLWIAAGRAEDAAAVLARIPSPSEELLRLRIGAEIAAGNEARAIELLRLLPDRPLEDSLLVFLQALSSPDPDVRELRLRSFTGDEVHPLPLRIRAAVQLNDARLAEDLARSGVRSATTLEETIALWRELQPVAKEAESLRVLTDLLRWLVPADWE